MVSHTIKLGGTASDITVGRISHGLMMMTWTTTPAPDVQCFEAIKAGVDALPAGTKMFLNSGEFYASDWGTANLDMISKFYARYPEYADKTFISVKGGIKNREPDASLDGLRSSVDNIQRALGTIKKLDLFEPARIDPKLPIEQIMQNLVTLLKEGKFSHIGLSECNADTLRKAHAVYPVTAAEIEISPWSYEDNQKRVIATAKELGISVVAYSPLGKGFLTGQIKSTADLPKGDLRAHMTRFKEENFEHNFAIVNALKSIAEKKGITPAQLCLAWVISLGPNVIPIAGSSKSNRTLENLASADISLSDEELREVNSVVSSYEIRGDRLFGLSDQQMHLWG